MNKCIEEIVNNTEKIKKIVISDPYNKSLISKYEVRPILQKGEIIFQSQHIENKKAFHQNYDLKAFELFMNDVCKNYKQVLVIKQNEDISFFINPDGKIKRKVKANNIEEVKLSGHNKDKNYILQEGEKIPALVDLGVFTKDFKIINSKYDKFKQINKFIEIVDDSLKTFKKDEITILDFGCGKSYLTFILYYYFVCKRNINAKIIGFDLKQDVVENCNAIAKKYGYQNLYFEVSDVTKQNQVFENVDMIVSLHACDTATDYALHSAIKYNVPYIFSVPCCQHQINNTIKKGGEFDVLLQDGLLKERFSALLTDAIRIELLRQSGYNVDAIEFVDFSHSPKNIMIRAKKVKSLHTKINIKEIMEKYNFQQELYNLIKNK